jgi:HMG (high mobility group) box
MSLGRHHDFSSSIYGQANSERRLRTRRASVSSSDDGQGGYDAVKHDDVDSELKSYFVATASLTSLQGGEDHSLTSQTLNADGTPKRPMNAFMIFARRRRPQVSAENQSLRTGEVSKLLSKEWSSMPAVSQRVIIRTPHELTSNLVRKTILPRASKAS